MLARPSSWNISTVGLQSEAESPKRIPAAAP
jgi:hypothetical protein